MGTRKVEQGRVGQLVAAEIRRRREQRGLSLQTLSGYLEVLGRPILPSGLSKIESGDRRVDVDDLVAIADALGTVPSALLRGGLPRENMEVTEEQKARVDAAIEALRRCEAAGFTRYEIVESMNANDAWQRVMSQRHDVGIGPGALDEMMAQIKAELQRGTPFTGTEQLPEGFHGHRVTRARDADE
jgi:transcriptional regulator with XRE-family HTH domain